MCIVFRLMIWHHVVSLQQRFAAVMVEEHTAHCPLTDVVVFFITLSQLFSYFKVQIQQSSHVQFHLKYTPCLKVFDVTSTNLIPVLNEFMFCSICVFVFLFCFFVQSANLYETGRWRCSQDSNLVECNVQPNYSVLLDLRSGK